jgi:diguanylate cyclase
MAASEINSERPPRGSIEYLSEHALRERLEEEINRAGRHGTALSCLIFSLDDLPELRRAGGEELCERALAYAQLALRRELRRFDRVGRHAQSELLLLLPGADLPHGEIVARRMLARLRSVKLEVAGERRTLRIAAGLAPWRAGMSASTLLDRARAAAAPENGRAPS